MALAAALTATLAGWTLALVPLRGRPATAALAAAWVATGVVFFSLAAAKRSVYLLPLYPAVALLLGAGVAAPAADGRLERLARLGALLLAPAGLGLAALAGALVLGFDPVPRVQPWLRPEAAAGAATLAAAGRTAAWPWSRRRAGRSSLRPRARDRPRRSRSERVIDPGEDRVPLRAAADVDEAHDLRAHDAAEAEAAHEVQIVDRRIGHVTEHLA